MAKIDLITKDYKNWDDKFDQDIIDVICQRLNIHRKKYWANPQLGSQLYILFCKL